MKNIKDLSFIKNTKIAHRGIYDNKTIYENSLEAFDLAIRKSFTIELDLRLLKDGNIICFHDKTLERMLHVDDVVETKTYEELNYISNYKIPLFKEVLELVNGEVPLLIELKSETKKGALESAVLKMLTDYKGLYAIQSFNTKTLKWFKKNRSDVIVGALVGKKNYKYLHFYKKFDFINININLLNDKRIRKLREDLLVLGYTVYNKAEYNLKKDVYDNLIIENILETLEG